MATKLQIWNRAARAAGETRRIESEAETTNVAAICADVYDDLVREVLCVREWPWAIAQSPLTEVGEQSIAYTGDGARTVFTVPYDIGDASQITVTVDGNEVELGTAYIYTAPTGGLGALVTFVSAPTLGSVIALAVTTKRVGWEHVYSLPADCLRPLALLRDGERRLGIPWGHRHGDQYAIRDLLESFAIVPNNGRTGYLLCTNNDQFAALEYVAHITEATAYPPHFAEALVRRLAAHLLDAVKKSPGEAQAMMQLYRAAIADAVAVANSSTGHVEIPESPALAARW